MLNPDLVKCLLCEKELKTLAIHLRKVHKVNPEGYAGPLHSNSYYESRRSGPAAFYSNSEKVRAREAKRKSTNLTKYGTEHSIRADSVQAKVVETNFQRFGGPTPFHSSEIQAKINESTFSQYGVVRCIQLPEYLALNKDTCLKRFGVDRPSKSHTIKEATKATNRVKFGTDWYTQTSEILEKRKITYLRHYGFDNPSKHPDYRRAASIRCNLPLRKTKPEWVFDLLTTDVVKYTGSGEGRMYVTVNTNERFARNPDFIIDPINITKTVIEIFGDWWHGEDFRKVAFNDTMSNDEHEQKVIDEYKKAGYDCLILWEHEVLNNHMLTQKVRGFKYPILHSQSNRLLVS